VTVTKNVTAIANVTNTVPTPEPATPEPATTDGSTPKVTVSTPATYGVNARSSASTDAPIIQLLAHSTVLRTIGRTADNSWLQIELADGTKAWIFTAAVLSNEGSILSLPIVTPPPLTQ